MGGNRVQAISLAAEKIFQTTLPKWNQHIPAPTKNLLGPSALRGEKNYVYFPSCISRQLGQPTPLRSASGVLRKSENLLSLAETLLTVSHRANLNLFIPENTSGICCGMPFASKGYRQAYQLSLHKTLMQMWEWSDQGRYPVIIDTTSCTQTLRTCRDGIKEEDKDIWKKLSLLDSVEFLHDFVLPKLEIQPTDDEVMLHPNCSARKLSLDTKILDIAKQCARSAIVPLDLGCCAFAGDRGLLFPELTASATEKETAEVLTRDYGGYYSSNITCEMGMSEATGKDYVGIVYLVENASR
ncbi:MAG: (Fe-S)-binding protein [Chloroflexota bacterium]|nr:(Fe-S)-binding protein [Chloroflexota bacterium]